jgi:hypothetical protein
MPPLRPLVPFRTRPPVHLTSLITRTRTSRLRKRRLHHARMPHPHLRTARPPRMPRPLRPCLQQTRHLMHPSGMQMLDRLHHMKCLRSTLMPAPLVMALPNLGPPWPTMVNLSPPLSHLTPTLFVHLRLLIWPIRTPTPIMRRPMPLRPTVHLTPWPLRPFRPTFITPALRPLALFPRRLPLPHLRLRPPLTRLVPIPFFTTLRRTPPFRRTSRFFSRHNTRQRKCKQTR